MPGTFCNRGLDMTKESAIRMFPKGGVSASSMARGEDSAVGTRRSSLLLIDGKPMTLESSAAWLANHLPGLSVVPLPSVDMALQSQKRMHDVEGDHVSVILLNIGAAYTSDPRVADDLSRLDDEFPNVPVIVISDREEVEAVAEALECGVRGYIPTSISLPVVVGAIYLVQAGGIYAPPYALMETSRRSTLRLTDHAMPGNSAMPGFTRRQMQVLAFLRQGTPNKIIAHELAMCESTVKVHVRHIMKKLRATNRTQVAFLTASLFGESGAGYVSEHEH